eukprot:CAMPEP_0185023398 /NCGR_PEP_ID=MMETSP1103-20130426/6072_1 /TAXON_ID=36769 /ORGANISM="Paraphysomonas bandaiensis, Strain Caron Lab Isolate" /LENGTH=314 /DNA_ID=CAMNT_0027555973 /DNA_START=123 /DNA_END=1063 /DNA_ORIENTATION=+
MVSIGTWEEQSALISALNCFHNRQDVYIGATDINAEATWIWDNGEPVAPYVNWDGGSAPSNAAKDCAYIPSTQQAWNDVDCTERKAYVCEADPLVSCVSSPTPSPTVQCPSGFSPYGNFCYFFASSFKKYSEVANACQNLGGYVLSINSAEEQEQLVLALEGQGTCNSYRSKFYIGYSDAAAIGTWIWDDGTGSGSFSFWKDGTDLSVNGNYDCAVFRSDNTWEIENCNTYLQFSCEADPLVIATSSPTLSPTRFPTTNPTGNPTENPTLSPTREPTLLPTRAPTVSPTCNPSSIPTNIPTSLPTHTPSYTPTS